MNCKYIMLLLSVIFLLLGCKNNAIIKNEKIIFAMDTNITLTIYSTQETFKKAEKIITNLETKLSTTNPKSEIYNINQNKSGILSEETKKIIYNSLELCKLINGNLDISIYPLVKLWGFTTKEYQIPEKETINALMNYVDYEAIQLDHETNQITLKDGMEIDLGSVAKGYTGDCIVDLLKEEGVSSALLNLGGNLQALGHKPDGSMWKVAIQSPFQTDSPFQITEYFGTIEIADEAVITSGNYERYFEVDGTRYCHIIDPNTGMPVQNSLVSVTIVGERGLICDGLSTALFVMGLEDGIEFWKENAETLAFDVIFVEEDGTVTLTEGLENRLKLADKNTNVEVIYH